MDGSRKLPKSWVTVLLCGACWGTAAVVPAQFMQPVQRREIAPQVKIEESADARRYFDQYDAYLKDGQWAEAVQLAQRLIAEQGDRLLALATPSDATHGVGRYVGVRELVFRRLLDPRFGAALALYRRDTDALARQKFEAAVAARDLVGLREMIDRCFPSRWTDEALDRLAEWSLLAGDFDAAREAWSLLLPPDETDPNRPGPLLRAIDPELPAADVYARLILVDILAGSLDRAERQLRKSPAGGSSFADRFPTARGTLAGKAGLWTDLLGEWLASAKDWPASARSGDWPTFAGAPNRNGRLPDPIEPAGKAWSEALPLAPVRVQPAIGTREFQLRRVGEDAARPLSYHPAVAEGIVYVLQRQPVDDGRRCEDQILAVELATGKPAWGRPDPVIFRTGRMPFYTVRSLGVPRSTLTVQGKRLYASVGRLDPTGPQFDNLPDGRQSGVVCIDLAGQGRLLWQHRFEEPGWEPEGAPLADARGVYVGLRQAGATPLAHVARLDADTGRLSWKRLICSAETRAQPGENDVSHNLLTLSGDTLYYNTNLGAIAALHVADGRPRWLTTVPRTPQFDQSKPQGFCNRDLTPCVIRQGLLFVAPADTPFVYCLSADSGQVLWSVEMPDVVHILGAVEDRLIVSGDRIYWVAFDGARPETPPRIVHWFGDGGPPGYGRGTIVGNVVYWPTRHDIHFFDAGSGRRLNVLRLFQEPAFRETCGNLVVADGRLLAAQADRLVCFQPFSPKIRDEAERWTRRSPDEPAAWFALARAAEALGERAAAIRDYRIGLAKVAGETPASRAARGRLEALHAAAISAAREAGDHAAAGKLGLAAAPDAPAFAAKAERLLAAAADFEAAGDPARSAAVRAELAAAPEAAACTLLDGTGLAWSLADRLRNPAAAPPAAIAPVRSRDPPPTSLADLWDQTIARSVVGRPCRVTVSEEAAEAVAAEPAVVLTAATDRPTLLAFDPHADRLLWEWTRPTATPPRVPPLSVVRLPDRFLVVEVDRVSALDVATGRPLWERAFAPPPAFAASPPADATAAWEIADPAATPLVAVAPGTTLAPLERRASIRRAEFTGAVLIVELSSERLTAFAVADGRPLWTRTASGRFDPHWSAGRGRVAIRELPPLPPPPRVRAILPTVPEPPADAFRRLTLAAADGAVLQAVPDEDRPWFAAPRIVSAERAILFPTASEVVSVPLDGPNTDPLARWVWWADPVEHAPWILAEGRHAVVFFGRKYMQGVDLSDGRPTWPAPERLDAEDFARPGPTAVIRDGTLFVAGRARVSARRLADGGRLWDAPLPAEFLATGTRVECFSDGLLVHAATVAGGGGVPWLRFDPKTGRRLQYEFPPLDAAPGTAVLRQGRTLLSGTGPALTLDALRPTGSAAGS